MKYRIVFISLLFILKSGVVNSTEPKKVLENEFADSVQQQLYWCFVYSNLFGFNISYVENPRLYETITEWMGTPYRYSGTSKKGVDCSGLVCELYKDCFNKDLDGSAGDLYKRTEHISKTDLREGDLVFL